MQLVINIDDELYEIIKNPNKLETMYHVGRLCEAVRNGTPLPKGHGDLIDRDELKAKYSGWYNLCNDKSICAVETKEIDWMPPIIEKDKESVVEDGNVD